MKNDLGHSRKRIVDWRGIGERTIRAEGFFNAGLVYRYAAVKCPGMTR